MVPMESELKAVGKATANMGMAVVAAMGEQASKKDMAALQAAIDNLQNARQASWSFGSITCYFC